MMITRVRAKTAIPPMLSVCDGARAVAFVQAAFGAEILFQLKDNGSVVAGLSIAEVEFWIADEPPANFDLSLDYCCTRTRSMALFVDDPDAVLARAVTAGATIVWPADDQPDGWRVGRVVDPFGHLWEISKPLPST